MENTANNRLDNRLPRLRFISLWILLVLLLTVLLMMGLFLSGPAIAPAL